MLGASGHHGGGPLPPLSGKAVSGPTTMSTTAKRVGYLAAAALLACLVTIPKLIRMAQIRGWLPGAAVEERVILEKWHETAAEHPRGRTTYWLLTGEGDIRVPGNHRINLQRDNWEGRNVGDPIAMVPLDGEVYLRDGIYASDGNFFFDLVLLAAELFVVIRMAALLGTQGGHETS